MNENGRSTKQLKIILDLLSNEHKHLTADEIYILVKNQLPKISLGTVYRNLEKLCSHGIIQKFHSGSRFWFDRNPVKHEHIRCKICNRVDDVSFSTDDIVNRIFSNLKYDSIEIHVEVTGLCPSCKIANHYDKKESKENGIEGN